MLVPPRAGGLRNRDGTLRERPPAPEERAADNAEAAKMSEYFLPGGLLTATFTARRNKTPFWSRDLRAQTLDLRVYPMAAELLLTACAARFSRKEARHEFRRNRSAIQDCFLSRRRKTPRALS